MWSAILIDDTTEDVDIATIPLIIADLCKAKLGSKGHFVDWCDGGIGAVHKVEIMGLIHGADEIVISHDESTQQGVSPGPSAFAIGGHKECGWERTHSLRTRKGDQLLKVGRIAIHPPGASHIDVQTRIHVHVFRRTHVEEWHSAGLNRIGWQDILDGQTCQTTLRRPCQKHNPKNKDTDAAATETTALATRRAKSSYKGARTNRLHFPYQRLFV